MANDPKIIAFMSGKGGAGKTTLAVAITKLLADFHHRSLLVDLDLATNGASLYLFNSIDKTSQGICEFVKKYYPVMIERPLQEKVTIVGIESCPNFFDFLPSRTRPPDEGQGDDPAQVTKYGLEDVKETYKYVDSNILVPLLDFVQIRGYEYVIVDCHAGYSESAMAALKFAKGVKESELVIVQDHDQVHTQATEYLIRQLGEKLTVHRHRLLNRIDIHDVIELEESKKWLQLNFDLFLPLDPDVRRAFGQRKIPVDLTKPSRFLFSLLTVAKTLFPELKKELEEKEREHTDAIFKDNVGKEHQLKVELRALEEEKVDLSKEKLEAKLERLRTGLLVVAAVCLVTAIALVAASISALTTAGIVITLSSLVRKLFETWHFSTLLGVSLFTLLPGLSLRKVFRATTGRVKKEIELEKAILSTRNELDQINSFALTMSREFLVDFGSPAALQTRGTDD